MTEPLPPTDEAPEPPARTRFADPAVPPLPPVQASAAPLDAPPEFPGELTGDAAAAEPSLAEPRPWVQLTNAPVVDLPPEVPAMVVVPEVAVPEVAVPAVPVAPVASQVPSASVAAQEPAAHPTLPDEPGPALPRRSALLAALTVVVVLLAALTGFLAWRVSDTAGPGPVEASRGEALQAARNAATLVFSYDYRHLREDFQRAEQATTDTDGSRCAKAVDPKSDGYDPGAHCFLSAYRFTSSKVVSDVALRYQAVVIAAVSAASVVEASETKALALVFLNQQSSSSLTSAPKVTQSRVEITLVRKNGHWLVSSIKPL